MIGQNLTGFWNRQDRFHILAGNLILSLMLACLVVSVVQLGDLALAGFNGAYLVALGFLVSLEATVSRRLLRGSSIFDPEWLLFHGTELVVILLAVKLVYYAQHGLDQLLVDAPRWLQDFLYAFMTPEYGFGCLVMALVWVLSTQLAAGLDLLYVDERILRQETESGIYEERDQIREHLVGALLGIGLGMIILAALLRSSRVMSWAELPALRTGVANLLVYFLMFLVLLSLTQFSLMRAHWMQERLSVGSQIARRWLLYSFVLILGLTLIARQLPTGYSIGLLAVLNFLISLSILIIYELTILLITPFLLLFYWLLSLFKTSGEPPPTFQMPQAPPPPVIQQTSTAPWLELLKSILFWAILLGVVGYSLYYYIRERQDLVTAARRLPFYPALARFWRWLARWLGGMQRGVSAVVGARLERLRAARHSAPRPQLTGYLGLRRLSPRQRVVFYYLAMVRRGEEAGMARQPAQTPYNYSRRLSQGLSATIQAEPPTPQVEQTIPQVEQAAPQVEQAAPQVEQTTPQVEQAIAALTEEFVEARYSLHPVTAQEVGLVQRCWESIRRALSKRP